MQSQGRSRIKECKKSKYQETVLCNIGMLYEAQEHLVNLFNEYAKVTSESYFKANQGRHLIKY